MRKGKEIAQKAEIRLGDGLLLIIKVRASFPWMQVAGAYYCLLVK